MAPAPTYDFYLTPGYRRTVSVVVGVFMYVFLVAFLPFGVSNYNPNHQYSWEFLSEIAKFMLLTIGLAWVMEHWLKPRLLRQARWQEVVAWSALLVSVIGLGNFLLYNWLGGWHDFSPGSALAFIGNCATVLVFPLVGTFFYFRYQALARRFTQIQLPQDVAPERLIHFEGQGSGDRLSIAASDFRYAQAQDNYVALYYLRGGTLKRELLRATLAELLGQDPGGDLLRCHRSFVVNPRQVRSFTGGNPVELYLDGVEAPIRVSRSYRAAVLQRLHAPSLQG